MKWEQFHYKIIYNFNENIGQNSEAMGISVCAPETHMGISERRGPLLTEYLVPETKTEKMGVEKPRWQNQKRVWQY